MKLLRLFTFVLLLPAPLAFAEDVINFTDHIRPIMQQSCLNCHNPDKAKGGLDLTSYSATLAGGSGGEIVVSQDPDGSRLLGVMAHTLAPKMPPNGGKVADNKLLLVRQWIEQGLRETANSAAAKPAKPRVDLSVGEAAMGRPAGPPIMPTDMPLGPIHHTPRPGAIHAIAGHPWSPIVAVTGQKQVLIYHTDTSELLGVLPFEHGQPQTLRFSWTGQLLMVGGGVGGQSGTVALYDVQTGNEISRVGEEVDAVLAADLDPTQRYVALGGPNKLVKGFDVATGEMIYKIDKHTEWVTAIAFSPDGDFLATGDRNGGLHIWEADTGLPVFTLDGHNASVTALAWRYDGKLLASSGDDGQVKQWEMEDGKQVKAWNAHGGGVQSVAFAEDGRLTTAGRDKNVRVWGADGNKLHEIKPFENLGLSAGFDTSGKVIIAGDLDGRLVRWSLEGDAKQWTKWSSNPPTIKLALAQSSERISMAMHALSTIEAHAQAKANEAREAEQSAKDADGSLSDIRQALTDAQRQQAKYDRERTELKGRVDAANQKRQKLRDRLNQSRDRLRAVEKESGSLARAHQQAEREAVQMATKLKRAEQEALKAADQSAKSPEDPKAAKRLKQLTEQVEKLKGDLDSLSSRVQAQADALAMAQAKVQDTKQAYETVRAEADRANQMVMANQEAWQKLGMAIAQSRQDTEQAKQAIKPAEQRRVAALQAYEQAAKSADEAQMQVDPLRQAVGQAKREKLKWEAAVLRLERDALRDQQAAQYAAAHRFAVARDERMTERDQTQKQLADAKAMNANGAAEITRLTQAKENAQQAVVQARKEQVVASGASKKHHAALAAQQTLTKQLEAKLAGQSEPDEALQQPLAEARAKLQGLEAIANAANKKSEQAELALEDAAFAVEDAAFALMQLREKLLALPTKIKVLQKDLVKQDGAIDQAQRELAEARKPGDALQTKIDQVDTQYRELRAAAGFVQPKP